MRRCAGLNFFEWNFKMWMRWLRCRVWWVLLGLWVAQAHAALPVIEPVEVAPSVWFVQGQSALGSSANANFISNAAFVVTPAGVVVADALGSPELAHQLIAAIRKITPQPITHVLVTHYHADHIYGLQAFKEAGAQIWAHRSAQLYMNSDTARLRLAASRQELAPWIDEDTRLVPADVWLEGDRTLEVGGVRFEIRHVGPAHTPEDLVVYVPGLKVLLAGDLVFRSRIPFVGQADSRRWIAALDQLLLYDASVILPGHGPMSQQARQDMQTTRDYLTYLRSVMGQATRDMLSFEEAYQQADWSAFAHLPLFRLANRMNAYNTYLLLEHETQ